MSRHVVPVITAHLAAGPSGLVDACLALDQQLKSRAARAEMLTYATGQHSDPDPSDDDAAQLTADAEKPLQELAAEYGNTVSKVDGRGACAVCDVLR